MRTLLILLLLSSPASAVDWSAWGESVAASVSTAPRTVTIGCQVWELDQFIATYYERGRNAGYHNPAGQEITTHLLVTHGFRRQDVQGLTAEQMTKLHIAHHAWESARQPTTTPSSGRWVQQRICTGRGRCVYRMVWVR